jgi:hypothetical protein
MCIICNKKDIFLTRGRSPQTVEHGSDEGKRKNGLSQFNRWCVKQTELDLKQCNEITDIPSELCNLKRLECGNCINLVEIPESLTKLKVLSCYGCKKLKYIPRTLYSLEVLLATDTLVSQRGIPKELKNLKIVEM